MPPVPAVGALVVVLLGAVVPPPDGMDVVLELVGASVAVAEGLEVVVVAVGAAVVLVPVGWRVEADGLAVAPALLEPAVTPREGLGVPFAIVGVGVTPLEGAVVASATVGAKVVADGLVVGWSILADGLVVPLVPVGATVRTIEGLGVTPLEGAAVAPATDGT